MKRNSNVNGIASSSQIPGIAISQMNYVRNANAGTEEDFLAYHFYIDKDFLDTYGLELAAGRDFREADLLGPQQSEDQPLPVMVNEKISESLGYKSADEDEAPRAKI